MNTQTLIVTAFLAASGPLAHAADFDPAMSAQAQAHVGMTRAEVKAETRQALAAGDITVGDAPYPKVATAAGAGPTRAEVKGALMRAIAARELHFSDTAYPDSGLYTTPRTKVRVKKVGPAQAGTTAATPTT